MRAAKTFQAGDIVGYLKLLYGPGPSVRGHRRWLCICRCLTIKEVQVCRLRQSNQPSCGCRMDDIRRDRHDRAVLSRSERIVWQQMKGRCLNTNRKDYERYGGRGVTVCERWLRSFDDFFHDVGKRPGPEYTLDRYPDKNGNYEPGNVRWATWTEQNRNKRNNRLLTLDDETLTLVEWSIRVGRSESTISARIDVSGWSIERALRTPLRTIGGGR